MPLFIGDFLVELERPGERMKASVLLRHLLGLPQIPIHSRIDKAGKDIIREEEMRIIMQHEIFYGSTEDFKTHGIKYIGVKDLSQAIVLHLMIDTHQIVIFLDTGDTSNAQLSALFTDMKPTGKTITVTFAGGADNCRDSQLLTIMTIQQLYGLATAHNCTVRITQQFLWEANKPNTLDEAHYFFDLSIKKISLMHQFVFSDTISPEILANYSVLNFLQDHSPRRPLSDEDKRVLGLLCKFFPSIFNVPIFDKETYERAIHQLLPTRSRDRFAQLCTLLFSTDGYKTLFAAYRAAVPVRLKEEKLGNFVLSLETGAITPISVNITTPYEYMRKAIAHFGLMSSSATSSPPPYLIHTPGGYQLTKLSRTSMEPFLAVSTRHADVFATKFMERGLENLLLQLNIVGQPNWTTCSEFCNFLLSREFELAKLLSADKPEDRIAELILSVTASHAEPEDPKDPKDPETLVKRLATWRLILDYYQTSTSAGKYSAACIPAYIELSILQNKIGASLDALTTIQDGIVAIIKNRILSPEAATAYRPLEILHAEHEKALAESTTLHPLRKHGMGAMFYKLKCFELAEKLFLSAATSALGDYALERPVSYHCAASAARSFGKIDVAIVHLESAIALLTAATTPDTAKITRYKKRLDDLKAESATIPQVDSRPKATCK
ncbi:MAG: tetratricopeptide repeat protein [Gammaproteobacteria bacterium]|nr:tetratricopeptide repeat protein [Gammaproteobacteria bacterium]